MFRFIVLIALVAGSIYAAPTNDKQSLRDSTDSWRYRYHFQHVFTDPSHSKIFAILNIKADAVIFLWGDWRGLKFENVTVEPLQSKINCPNPLLRMMTVETTPEVYNPIVTTVVKALEIPIRFKYSKGVFTKIKKHANDADESVNIKRAFLSLFEFDFDGLKGNASRNSSLYLEKNVQGLCKTNYIFTKDPIVPQQINVIKTIATDSCIVSPRTQTGLIMTPKEDSCKPRLNMMEVTTTIRYKINNTESDFIIQDAVSESRYNLLLSIPSEGSMVLSLNQTLRFIRKIIRSAPATEPKVPISLISEVPSHSESPFLPEDVIKKIVPMIRGDIQAKNVNEIIMLLERLDVQNIKKIWSSTESRRNLVVDMFTKVDTKEMRVFWIDNVITLVTKYANSTSDLALFQSPDRALMETLLGALKTARLSKEAMQQLSLKIGAYANKFSVLLETLDKQIRVGDKLMEQAQQSMRKDQKKLKDIEEIWQKEKENKVLIMTNLTSSLDKVLEVILQTHVIDDTHKIKTLGNMGYNKTLPVLMDMIRNRRQPTITRMQAIDALRKMPQSNIEEIQKELLQVYVRPSENAELRAKALLVLTKFPVSQSMIMALILTYQHEVSSYVGPFAYKYLSEISRSKFVPLKKMSVRAEKVLTSVEPVLPMMLKEKMSIPYIYEDGHELWSRMSSLLVWHFSASNALSLSSAAMDVQIIPGVIVNRTSISIRVRSSSLANYDDVEVEISAPYTLKDIVNMVRLYDR
uniref:Vitellogenin n=1 Tax=Sepiella maindroni TaxID=153280 RepID=A0A2L0V7Q4_9MOLL|nr:vitellogenin [Sepiella maindroni]